ncbi:MAG: peptidylprolyl isomerase [Planctomycetes bacterium]|nr:peptidylprolyl isomerase [Planctomycetota bacterium]
MSPSKNASAEVERFRDDAVALLRRPELDLERVTVQYVLVATGVIGISDDKPDLPLAEAEQTAAEIYAKARAGDDFDKLVLTHSYGQLSQGQRPGTFTLVRGELSPNLGPTTFKREQQEDSVWRAAWRLQPGEIGAVEKHEKDANSGYYVIRRLTEDEIRRDDPANFPPADAEIKAMREDAAALLARPEHHAAHVKVQHLLIGRYMSDPDGRKPRLSPNEAEALAAEAFAKAKSGESFDTLVREYSYDQINGEPPGVYLMVADKDEADRSHHAREGMIPWFGDAAWRLQVGEIGVILYDDAKSWYGYHIIKRIE